MKIQRIRQFFQALTAERTEADEAFINEYLKDDEQVLFYQMNLPDQCHALQVAYQAKSFAEGLEKGIRFRVLIRAALLHDIGRKKGDMGTLGKVFAVLFYAGFPRFAKRWASFGRGSFLHLPQHILYIYQHHPEIGAKELEAIGAVEEARLIRRHHQPEAAGDSVELRLLRRADRLH